VASAKAARRGKPVAFVLIPSIRRATAACAVRRTVPGERVSAARQGATAHRWQPRKRTSQVRGVDGHRERVALGRGYRHGTANGASARSA
jgi:hypothetical protein